MKILAFLLQVSEALTRMEEKGLRESLLARLLFHGGRTGRVLNHHLGEKLCLEIVWEESTKMVAGPGVSANSFPADLYHMRAVIEKHQPTVILCFGKVAEAAVAQIVAEQDEAIPRIGFAYLRTAHVTIYNLPHPASRERTKVIRSLRMLRGILEPVEM